MISPRLVIAAPASGSGKTTLTTGLMAAFSETMRVQGFKVGPDYIDPGYHTAATGRISRNLDTWMMPPDRVMETYARSQRGSDLSIIEGVMGFYDGYEGRSERGSTAEVAKLLDVPVVLVIDVSKMVRSAGAIALGFQQFDPQVKLAGVIANRTGSQKHADWVREAIEGAGIPVLGCVPRRESLNVPERHLGLYTADERSQRTREFLLEAKQVVQEHVDLERLLAIAGSAPDLDAPQSVLPVHVGERARIAVARDHAFCFYYEDNFDLLRAAGAEIVFFSPLEDTALPENAAGLYLGGGYPELYAAQLSANQPMRRAIREAVEGGLPTFAECGGLMMLAEKLIDVEGAHYPMCAVLPGAVQMTHRLVLGYREVEMGEDTLLLPQGGVMRGHEFHYSEWIQLQELPPHPLKVRRRDGALMPQEGYARANLLASYVHVHFASNPDIAPNFVRACR